MAKTDSRKVGWVARSHEGSKKSSDRTSFCLRTGMVIPRTKKKSVVLSLNRN
jgi:hypothetical protein